MPIAGRVRAKYCLAVLLATVAPEVLIADGWKIQLQGGKALGTSYAGRSVLADDASVVWFNPANMTELTSDWTLTADGPLITYDLVYHDHDSSSRSVLGQPLQGEATRDGGMTAIVPHVYVVKRLNDRFRAGFGFNAPYGLGTDYDQTWVGRYHATETRLTVFNLNPAVAARIAPQLSVAFGLDVQRSSATLANMIDFGSIGAALGAPLTPQQLDGRIKFDGSDWAFGWNAGVLWKPRPGSRIGASFRSEIDHALHGPADFTVPSPAAFLTAGGLFADTGARITLPMPAELSVSASQDINNRWTLLGDVTWTQWSQFKALRVAFENPLQPPVEQAANWHDASRAAVGARARVSRSWTVETGFAYEDTPVPDATRTPRLPEADHTWLSAAARYSGSGPWSWDFHVSHLITPDASIHLTDPAAGVLNGTVHWRLTVFGVSATRRF